MTASTTSVEPLFLWAHRGASGYAPENTLAAFRLAEYLGARGIELDVHLSRDGVPVVMHDPTVERTTDGRGRVARLDLEQLRRLDAGRWYAAAFAGEPVPTLAEVFAWAGDRVRLNVEIKHAAAGEAVLTLWRQYPQVRVLISSFAHDLLDALGRQVPQLPRGYLTTGRGWRQALARAVAGGAESFHPAARHTSAALVAAARQAGLAVYPYTVDDPAEAARLQHWGVAGIFTNRLFPGAAGD